MIPSGAFYLLLGCLAAVAGAEDMRPRVLSWVNGHQLGMSVGEYVPQKGWIQAADFYPSTQPGDRITIFGVAGKLGEVSIIDKSRTTPFLTPADWTAQINRGRTASQPFALAIQGSWPDSGVESKELPLDDPESVRIAADFLKTKGLHVETPLLTQAYQSDLAGDGRTETLLCAHSDAGALRDDREADIYAVALLRTSSTGKERTIAIASQTSYKPASRFIEEHERLYGTRDFYRFLAFHDIDGDGKKEIVLYRAKDDATQIDVYTFDGRRVRRVLSAYKPNYN